MTVKEAACLLGVSPSMVYKLMNAGELSYVQVGRRRLPVEEDVKAYKQRNTKKGVKKQGKKTAYVPRFMFQ
jgi:excisionase family DNA binding protein